MEMDRKGKRAVAIILAVLAIVTTIIIISVVANNSNDDNMSDSTSENISYDSSSSYESEDVPTSDRELIKALNDHIDEYVKENGNLDYFTEVVEALNENNISLDSLTSSSDGLYYLYDSYSNKFVIYKDNKIIYPSIANIENKAIYYKIINSETELNKFMGFSLFISNNFDKEQIEINKISNIESEKSNISININDTTTEGAFALIGSFAKVNVNLNKAKLTIFKQINELTVTTKSSVDVYGRVLLINLNDGIINTLTGAKIDVIDATNATNNSKVNKSKSSEIKKIISSNDDICDDKTIIVKP